MELSKEDFGIRLKQLRKEKGLTQWQLSQLTGIDPTQISQYESGMYYPRRKTLNKLSEALGFELTDIFTVTNDFPSKLRKLRQERGFTQLFMSRELEIRRSMYQGYESGRLKPKKEVLDKIEELFGVKFYEEKKTTNEPPLTNPLINRIDNIIRELQTIKNLLKE